MYSNAHDMRIPTLCNTLIASCIVTYNLLVLIALPLWLLPASPAWALLIPLFIWVHNTHWALIHESVHRLFSPSEKWNEYAGRGLGILMGASFHVLRFGHMMHHQYNREWESEIHDGKRPLWVARVSYYAKLLGGIYIMEVAITLFAAILPSSIIKRILQGPLQKAFPPAAAAAEQTFLRRGKLRQVRMDGMVIILLYSAVAYLYGTNWPYLLFFLYCRALAVSFFDNIYHYATAADNSEAAVELAMPSLLSKLLLHGNYHETHHLKPSIPWSELPNHQHRPFGKSFLEGARQQWNGPVMATDNVLGLLRFYPQCASVPAGGSVLDTAP